MSDDIFWKKGKLSLKREKFINLWNESDDFNDFTSKFYKMATPHLLNNLLEEKRILERKQLFLYLVEKGVKPDFGVSDCDHRFWANHLYFRKSPEYSGGNFEHHQKSNTISVYTDEIKKDIEVQKCRVEKYLLAITSPEKDYTTQGNHHLIESRHAMKMRASSYERMGLLS